MFLEILILSRISHKLESALPLSLPATHSTDIGWLGQLRQWSRYAAVACYLAIALAILILFQHFFCVRNPALSDRRTAETGVQCPSELTVASVGGSSFLLQLLMHPPIFLRQQLHTTTGCEIAQIKY